MDNHATQDPATPLHPYSVVSDGKDAKEKDTSFTIVLSGGSDGSYDSIKADPKRFTGVDDADPAKRTGMQAFLNNEVVSIIAVPGVTDKVVQVDLVAHCEKTRSRVAILDVPLELVKPDDILTKHRDLFDTSFAAMYGPWLQVFDPLDKRNIFIPPSGSVAGIFARSDNTRGVSKAPANEVVRGCTGLSTYYNNGAQDILNPKGVNLIRSFPGQGIRVWGARTLSSNGLWKYINVRRLFIFVEETVRRGTNWIVFEPNDEPLWARVHRTIDVFMTGVWRSGALMGASPADAYYIKIGRATMTQDDIDNGRLICEIGIAPVKPAEFVIFRFTQKTGDAQ
jgi:phage tail sheath protein FI